MKKADLRDIIDMWREVAMVRLSQVQGLEAEKRGLEERLAATQRLVAQQAMVRGARLSTAESGARVTVDGDGTIRSYDATGVQTFGPPEVGRLLDPADTAKVGDPDPTTSSDDGCPKTDSGWWCTRSGRHLGQHVAGDGTKVCHVWTNVPDADPLPDGGTHTCPRCSSYVEALPPRRICDECETEVGVLAFAVDRNAMQKVADRIKAAAAQSARIDDWTRDRTAAIEGAATTLRAHVRIDGETDACTCGWNSLGRPWKTHPRHVAEQLAAVGALGDAEPVAARPVLVDRDGDEWWPTVGGRYVLHPKGEKDIHHRPEIEAEYGPVIEKQVES